MNSAPKPAPIEWAPRQDVANFLCRFADADGARKRAIQHKRPPQSECDCTVKAPAWQLTAAETQCGFAIRLAGCKHRATGERRSPRRSWFAGAKRTDPAWGDRPQSAPARSQSWSCGPA